MSAVVIVHPGKVGDRKAAQARLAGLAEASGHEMPQWVETSAEDTGPDTLTAQSRRAPTWSWRGAATAP